ncbi:TWiK family of potassium channels protein 7 isoform X2 [Aethina tumida]|uniref:TWiK family of potassium channels protein 7 isoform X2 n=1 Tax=Aethina tumida TaxID=116153 RepID=UPI0021486A75|nr:TWiK family of potassium channels protein 7 isoform X2 [Aethina tumida]
MERKRSVRRQRKRKTFAKKCREYCRQFIAFLFSNVGIILLVVGYTIAGSFIFMHIEKRYHMELKKQVNYTRQMYAEKFWNMTLEMNPFDEVQYRNVVMRELETYQMLFVNFTRKGYDGFTDEETSSQWSFAGAFLYSLTVITTIGYGNIFPHTPEGKIITIVYAIIGMPLFLLYLSNIGDIMARSFKWIYANCCLCRWCPGVAKRRAERRMIRAQLEEFDEGSSESNSSSYQINIERPSLSLPRGSMVSQHTELTDFGSEASYDVQTVTVPVTICLMIMVYLWRSFVVLQMGRLEVHGCFVLLLHIVEYHRLW